MSGAERIQINPPPERGMDRGTGYWLKVDGPDEDGEVVVSKMGNMFEFGTIRMHIHDWRVLVDWFESKGWPLE